MDEIDVERPMVRNSNAIWLGISGLAGAVQPGFHTDETGRNLDATKGSRRLAAPL